MNGDDSVKILLSGSSRLREIMYSDSDGGSDPRGLRELVNERFGEVVAVELDFEASGGASELREALSVGRSKIVEASPDLLVLSVDVDLDRPASEGEAERYYEDTLHVIRSIKEDPGSHIVVLNASTIDPGQLVSNYQRVTEEPGSLRAHKYDLAVVRLSFEEGISIVDVDRILAERGAAGHVLEFQGYSSIARDAIRAELVRIMEDYGFFDERPLLPQIGRETG